MEVQYGLKQDAEFLVNRWHYSHRMPSNIQLITTWHLQGGLFGDCGKAVAGCIFSIPPTRWGEPVVELSRLVRSDDCIEPLTGLIAIAVKRLRMMGVDLVVSFADYTVGHHGGIYQAASWNYHGKRERRMDGVMLGQTFIPGKSCNNLYGTQSPQKLVERFPQWDIAPHYDEGKFLYWKALRKSGISKAKRLNLSSKDYPKPSSAVTS